MPSLTSRVFRNTLTVFTGTLLYQLLGFLWSVKLARYLTPEGFGLYASLYAYVAFCELLANTGIDMVTVRKISTEPERTGQWLLHGCLLKLGLSGIGFSLALLGIGWLPADRIPVGPYVWIAAWAIFYPAFTFLGVVFQARLKMAVPMAGKLLAGAAFMTSVFVLTARRHDLHDLVLAKVLCFLVWPSLLAVLAVPFMRKAGRLRLKTFAEIFRESVPFFLSSIFILVYYRIDVLMIGWMMGQAPVGYYSAAFRLTESLSMAAGALMTSLYPVFSRDAREAPERLRKGYRLSLKYLMMFILPAAVGTTALAPDLMRFFYREAYLPAATVLAILVWAQVFNTAGYVLSYLLYATRHQHVNAWTNVGMIVLNVGLNLLLIPVFGYNGAGMATVATEAFSVVVWLWVVTRVTGYFPSGWLARPLLAAAVMGGFLWFLPCGWCAAWPLAAQTGIKVLAGMTVFGAAFVLMGGVTREDREVWRQLRFNGRSSREGMVD